MTLTRETALKVAKTIWTHKAGKALVAGAVMLAIGALGLKVAPATVHGLIELALAVAMVLV